jgi:hypothetical protein
VTIEKTHASVETLRLLEVKEAAKTDSKALIAEINAFDPTTLERFNFTMFPADNDPLWWSLEPRADEGWLWQSEIVDWWNDPDEGKYLILKARQLGITWLAMAQCVWYLLYRPGSRCVAYSYSEDEAKKLVARAWLMFNSLPEELRNGVEIIAPARAEEPSEWIKVKHTWVDEDGKTQTAISSIQALPATKKAGHGETVTFAVMDEVARQDYARQIYTAINPAVSRGLAKLVMISTANGVGNPETGEGNYFHILYCTQIERGIAFKFLPWNLEPTRDEEWYAREAMALDEVERNQQYPLNENDAFMLSGALYFDSKALQYYRMHSLHPVYRAQFTPQGPRKATLVPLRDGCIEVWEEPRAGAKYAIGCDVSTGRSTDYTSGDVIDLETGSIVASYHAKHEAPMAAIQLHFLGKWYNTARIAIERQGGYGEALITLLRDGTKGMPPYPNLYRHTDDVSGTRPISQQYGMPMGMKMRPLIVTGLKQWVYQQQFPWLSKTHVNELGTFVYKPTGTSPAAQDGCNDDRVMSLGITVEMFRQFGHHPQPRVRSGKKSGYQAPPMKARS